MKESIELLKRTRQRFTTFPESWTKGIYKQGNQTCLIGGLDDEFRRMGPEYYSYIREGAYDYLIKAIDVITHKRMAPENYNDMYAENVGDIIKVIDIAIEGATCEQAQDV